MALQIRRGTEAERTAGGGVVFAEGELIYVTDTDGLFIGDGSTAGGVKLTDNAGAVLGTYITADTINSTLDLQQNLDLNGKDIVGTGNINIDGTITATGNINIGDDADSDTVDFTAKITSSLTPSADSTHNIGAMNARWNNGYFTGLWVDGQINAVSLNGDVLANDSTLLVNATSGKIVGDVLNSRVVTELVDAPTDDLYVTAVNDGTLYLGTTNTRTVTIGASDTTVYVNGDQDSIIAGGQFVGDLKGSVFGDDSTLIIDAVANTLNGNLTGNVTGDLTGDVTGDLSGQVKGSSGTNVLSPNTGPADAELSVLNVTATGTISGNVTGNLTGNVTGDLTGNAGGDHTGTFTGAITATGTLDGDLTGSVFSDASVTLVDSVSGTIPASVIDGTLTNDLTGNVTGDIFTNTIDSSDSSAINVVPIVNFNTTVNAQQDVQISDITDGILINRNGIKAYSVGVPKTLEINKIASSITDETTELEILNNTVFEYDVTVEGKLQAFGDRAITAIHRTQLGETNNGFFVTEYSGDPVDPAELQDIANYTIKTKIIETVADFGTAVKFANMDTTTRNGLTAEAGMVIFNTTDTKLQVYTGSTWVDLH